MNIISVLGPILSGKSTVVDKYNCEEYVIVRIGRLLREMIGEKVMLADPNPNACLITDDLVASIAIESIRLGIALNRFVVFDGYPRKASQVGTLEDTFYKLQSETDFNWRVFYHNASEALIQNRLKQRTGKVELFDEGRIVQSRRDFTDVMDRVHWLANNPRRNYLKVEIVSLGDSTDANRSDSARESVVCGTNDAS